MEDTKRNKRAWIISIIIIIVLLVAAIVLLKIFGNNPEKTVNTVFSGLKDGKIESINEYFVSDSSEDTIENELSSRLLSENNTTGTAALQDLIKSCFAQLDWKIQDSKIEGDTATVTVEVTNKDFSNIMQDFFTELIGKAFTSAFSGNDVSEEELMNSLKSKVDATTDLKTNTGEIKLTKQDNVWKIDEDIDSLFTILLPGMMEKIDQLQNSFNSFSSQNSSSNEFNESNL